jgi:hypothetical protein
MIRTAIKTAAVALTLGMAATAAAPAQAGHYFEDDFDVICMTDYQIRTYFEDKGFDKVFLNVSDEDGVLQVKAIEGKRTFLVEFDSCEQEVLDIEEI